MSKIADAAMQHPFDDGELLQQLNAAGADWLDGRTCRVNLDRELADWFIAESGHTPFPEEELAPYIEALPAHPTQPFVGFREPILIRAGWHYIEDGAHRVHAVATSGRGYSAVIHILGGGR